VRVYGDTNSTLAGALAASKLSVPVIHVEAGLRSFNRRMPEEINRVVADHLSAVLLCPSETAVRNMAVEGVTQNVHLVGDVMLDVLNWARRRADGMAPQMLDRLGLTRKRYILATVHRSENTDDPARLARILEAFNSLSEPVVFPIHPRARKAIADTGCCLKPHVHPIDPLGYLQMMALTGSARLVLTDSGGLQKEAYWLEVPCVTLRDETEWIETVAAGWNVLVGADSARIAMAADSFSPPPSHPLLYGDGTAGARCVDLLPEAASIGQPRKPESTEIAYAQRAAR
jgi:UDP-N-acetylglucosamine 2-epimerase